MERALGQNHIYEHFKNAIAAGKLSHAYILHGERGMGKLNIAKEAAKATRAARPEKSAAFLPALIDEAAQKAYVLGCESCVVGRSPDCDVKLRYSPISSEHAKIYKNGTAWFIEDMNSATGTKVNARAVGTGRRRLKDGDIIGLGGVIFVFNEYYKIKK